MLFYNEKIFKRCFNHRGWYWYKNIKEIPLYFKLMHHLIQHGYDEYATWETYNWFVAVMKDILPAYYDYYGIPIVVDNYPMEVKTMADQHIVDKNTEKWYSIIDRMLELLDLMDESNPEYEGMNYSEQANTMNKAKDEFFELFSRHFYNLWD